MASSVTAAGVGLPGRTLHEANQQELEATLRLVGPLEYEDVVLVTLGRHVVEDAADHSAEVLRASDGLTVDVSDEVAGAEAVPAQLLAATQHDAEVVVHDQVIDS